MMNEEEWSGGHPHCSCEKSGQCEQCGCGGKEGYWSYEEDFAGMMMHLAKKAKMELLKEKMKRRLEATEGKKLDDIADLVVETMLAKKKLKEELSDKEDELEEKWSEMETRLDEIFSRDK